MNKCGLTKCEMTLSVYRHSSLADLIMSTMSSRPTLMQPHDHPEEQLSSIKCITSLPSLLLLADSEYEESQLLSEMAEESVRAKFAGYIHFVGLLGTQALDAHHFSTDGRGLYKYFAVSM